MKSLNENYLVKSVYAYIDLAYKVFPFFFLLLFLPLLISGLTTKSIELRHLDVFRLFIGFDNEFSKIKDPSLLFWGIVSVVNLAAFVCIFLSLKKLTAFIKNVFNNNPLCGDNGRSLKFVGIIVASFAVFYHISRIVIVSFLARIVSATTSLLVSFMGAASIVLDPYLILGLFIVILGEIIIHGAKLKEENDLTV